MRSRWLDIGQVIYLLLVCCVFIGLDFVLVHKNTEKEGGLVNKGFITWPAFAGTKRTSPSGQGKRLAHEPSGPHRRSRFPYHEATRSIATPPGWDASPSQVTPSISSCFPDNLLIPIYIPGWREAL